MPNERIFKLTKLDIERLKAMTVAPRPGSKDKDGSVVRGENGTWTVIRYEGCYVLIPDLDEFAKLGAALKVHDTEAFGAQFDTLDDLLECLHGRFSPAKPLLLPNWCN